MNRPAYTAERLRKIAALEDEWTQLEKRIEEIKDRLTVLEDDDYDEAIADAKADARREVR